MCRDHYDHNKRMLDSLVPPHGYHTLNQGGIQTGTAAHVAHLGTRQSFDPPPVAAVMIDPSKNQSKQPAAAAKKKKATMEAGKLKPGGGGDLKYTKVEIDALMDICEDIIPMGKNEWERITNRYNKLFPSRPRQEKSLRGQLNSYAKQKPPTGDRDCPPLVARAKKVMKKIQERAEIDMLEDPAALARHELPVVSGGDSAKKSVVSATSSRGNRKQKRSQDFLEYIKASERRQAKREERQYNFAIGALSTIVTAITGKQIPSLSMPQSNDNDNLSDGDDNDLSDSDLDDDMYKTPRTKKSRVDKNNKSKVCKGTIDSDDSDADKNSILMKSDEERGNI